MLKKGNFDWLTTLENKTDQGNAESGVDSSVKFELPPDFQLTLTRAIGTLNKISDSLNNQPSLSDKRIEHQYRFESLKQAVLNLARLVGVAVFLSGCSTKFEGPEEVERAIEEKQTILAEQFAYKSQAEIEVMADSLIALERAEYLNTLLKPYLLNELGQEAPAINVTEVYQAMNKLGFKWSYLARTDSTLPAQGPEAEAVIFLKNLTHSDHLASVISGPAGRQFNWLEVPAKAIKRDLPPPARKLAIEYIITHELVHTVTMRGRKHQTSDNLDPVMSELVEEPATDLIAILIMQSKYGQLSSSLMSSAYTNQVPVVLILREALGAEKFASFMCTGDYLGMLDEFEKLSPEANAIDYAIKNPSILNKIKQLVTSNFISSLTIHPKLREVLEIDI